MRALVIAAIALLPLAAQAQSPPVFTGPNNQAAQQGDAIKLGEVIATITSKQDYSGPMGIVPDVLKIAADGTDDAPSIQRALAQVCAGTSHVLRFRARIYTIASGINAPCAAHWIGQGWQEPNGGTGTASPGLGTWFRITGTGYSAVTISGSAASGTVVEGIGVSQVQPAPAVGWTPTPYPYAFYVTGTNGEVTFRHMMFLGVDKGITAYYAGRLKLQDVRGQFFTNAVYADKNYDASIIEDVRNWPYWSQDSRVMAYQQANFDMIILGRVDDTFADRLFSLPGRSVLKLVTTAADPTNPASLPGGSPTNTHVGSIRGDFSRWVIWNTATASQFDDVEVSVNNLIHQGAVWNGLGTLVPMAGSAAIKNDGSFRLWSIGHLKADVLDATLVDASAATGASTIQIGRAMVIFSHSTATACTLLLPGTTASVLQFSLPPAVSQAPPAVSKVPAGSTGTVTWNTPS